MRAATGSRLGVVPAEAWMRLGAVALALICSAWPVHAPAQGPPRVTAISPDLQGKLAKRGDLTLSNTPFQQALFTISEQWGINIVVAEEVQGTVTGSFKQAPLHEILDSILLANGYGYRPVGESFVIMKLETLGDFNPMFETAAISLVAVKPEDILASAQSLASPKGKVQAVPSARSLLVFDFPDRVRVIRDFAERLDQAASGAAAGSQSGGFDVFQYVPQFVKAMSLKDSLTSLLSTEGKLTVVEPENRLVVIDRANVIPLVRKAVLLMDAPRAQVRIAAIIYDAALDDLEKCGINWNSALKGRHNAAGEEQSSFALDSLQQVPVAAGDPSGVMTLMSLSRHYDLTAVLDFLRESENSQLLADPMVIVSDMEDAEISIVTEIPYQQLTQTQQGGNIGTTAFREAGVKLMVRPQIAADGTVLMAVTPEFSRLTGFTDGQQPQPIIDRRTAKTVVRVLNGQTFVIGGLRQRSDINNVRGLPYLMDIKFLGIGKLFRTQTTQTKQSELIVFLTPVILGPCNPNTTRENMAVGHAAGLLESIPPAGQTPLPSAPCDPSFPPAMYEPAAAPAYEQMPGPSEALPTPPAFPQAHRENAPPAMTPPLPAAPVPSGGPAASPAPLRQPPTVSSPEGVIDLRPRAMREPQTPQPTGPPLAGPRPQVPLAATPTPPPFPTSAPRLAGAMPGPSAKSRAAQPAPAAFPAPHAAQQVPYTAQAPQPVRR